MKKPSAIFQHWSRMFQHWSRMFHHGDVGFYTRNFLAVLSFDGNPVPGWRFLPDCFWFGCERDGRCKRYRLALGFLSMEIQFYD